MEQKTKLASTALLMLLVPLVAATDPVPPQWLMSLRGLAYAFGWLCMVIMGLKWLLADSANERADAKKSMIYIVIGLLIVASACNLLQLYCNTVSNNISGGFTCNLGTYGCT